jgi:hypothetical protein
MKKIRKNVFETNSSSTHTVCIASGSTREDIRNLPKLNEEGDLEVYTGEYGWEIANYNQVEDRISYATTFALNKDLEYAEQEKPIDDIKFKGPHIDMLVSKLKEFTGANNIIFIKGFGYIDHQSWDEASEIFESEESLEQFLFNPLSHFMTDNDNH